MAARLNPARGAARTISGRSGLLLAVLLLVAACGSGAPSPPTVRPSGGLAIVPAEAGLSPAEASAVVALRGALAPLGLQLSAVAQAVQPAEPVGFAAVPRVVYRIELADPDQGYVLLYDFPTAAAAAEGAVQLGTFLASGPGQASYPVDARFSVAQFGSAVVFTWWSAQRASDTARAEAAFGAVAGVGQPVPVVR